MSTDGSHTVSSAHQMRRVVVVGAGLAGLRACQTLRDRGYDGALTLFGAESHLPYDRPPLSKQVLAGTWKPEQADLKGGESLGDLGVEVRLETTATALDAGARELTLKGGERIGFDGLVVATGANARLLPGITGRPNVLTLRTIEDCLELRRVLERPGARLVLAGGWFIGLEVAATARRLGAEVAVVEPLSVPLERVVRASRPSLYLHCPSSGRAIDHVVAQRSGLLPYQQQK